MSFKTFTEMGGFKLLAVARLSSGSYSIVCYLLNCLAAGIDDVVSSPGELAVLLGISEKVVKQAVAELVESKIVVQSTATSKSLVLRMVLDSEKWVNLRREPTKTKRSHLGDAKNLHRIHPVPGGLSFEEALLFPVKRPKGVPPQLLALEGGRQSPPNGGSHGAAHEGLQGAGSGAGATPKRDVTEREAERIYDAFQAHHARVQSPEKEHTYAYLLAESHPPEQVLEIIQHFAAEIPSLGLLAGAWLHYSEKFHKDAASHTQLDFAAFRKKHEAAEKRLRSLSNAELKRAQQHKLILNADEELLLRLFMRHEHPRKQLYWALQARDRYPHLQDFLSATSELAVLPDAPRRV